MKLSTRTRYGVRSVLELAKHYGEGPLQIKVIAERQEISVKYLEQLMAMLKTGGFVRSIRGSRGGYLLAKPPNQIRLSEVFISLEGPVMTVDCVEDESMCSRVADCLTRQVWREVQDTILGVLESKTLQDMLDSAIDKDSSYQI